MTNRVFVIDLRRGDDCRRFATEDIPLILKLLGTENLKDDLEYLRIERVPQLSEVMDPGVRP